jgi:hypothetical protein
MRLEKGIGNLREEIDLILDDYPGKRAGSN